MTNIKKSLLPGVPDADVDEHGGISTRCSWAHLATELAHLLKAGEKITGIVADEQGICLVVSVSPDPEYNYFILYSPKEGGYNAQLYDSEVDAVNYLLGRMDEITPIAVINMATDTIVWRGPGYESGRDNEITALYQRAKDM